MTHILFPLKQAFMTPLGDLMVFLTITFLALLSLYTYFWFKFGRQKDLTLIHQNLFRKIERQLVNVSFKGIAKSDFFGKKQVVSLTDGKHGQCLLFYPRLSNKEVQQRFEQYHLLLQKESSQVFPHHIFSVEQGVLVNIETQYMMANGQTLINFSHYIADKMLSDAEKELFLIDTAYMLEALHSLTTQSGEGLYHGFLLPTSFYLTINMVKKMTHIYLSDHGCAFALGGHLFKEWLKDLYDQKFTLDPFVKKHLEKFKFIFSPEQRGNHNTIGQATDFYSYAALSVYLFTQKPFENVNDIEWDKIPKGWHRFLKRCLIENPRERPTNFLELKEYFDQPELDIVQFNHAKKHIEEKNAKAHLAEDLKIDALKGYFEKFNHEKHQLPIFDESWKEGFIAIKESNWDKAHDIFSKMKESSEHAFNGQLGLAILYFQKGEQDKAQEHYQEAKKIDAKKISCFHKLITFDI